MKERNRSALAVSNFLIALAVCFHLPLAARAADAGDLKAEAISLDALLASDSEPSKSSSETMLHGGVRRRETLLDAGALVNPAQTQDQSQLHPRTPLNDAVDLRALALQKLSRRQKLSSDEYRSLGAGVAGFQSNVTFFQKVGRVTDVYADSPAAKAGIRVGDKFINDKSDPVSDARETANPHQPLLQFTFAQAGTPVDVTFLRHKRPVTITLIRMNIEDIQEAGARRQWEQTISHLGYPQEGVFVGTSAKDLQFSKDVPDSAMPH